MTNDRLFVFVGGVRGLWKVARMQEVKGPGLARVERLDVLADDPPKPPQGSRWMLRGVTSNERYVNRPEHDKLVAVQPSLGRPEATCAALIPISKSDEWWKLSQDQRRAIFEEQSRHIATGLKYLPAVARRLHHSRDLGEPFDFLTWFEYAPEHVQAFEELVDALRQTEEWKFVTRELDIRLVRENGA